CEKIGESFEIPSSRTPVCASLSVSIAGLAPAASKDSTDQPIGKNSDSLHCTIGSPRSWTSWITPLCGCGFLEVCVSQYCTIREYGPAARLSVIGSYLVVP